MSSFASTTSTRNPAHTEIARAREAVVSRAEDDRVVVGRGHVGESRRTWRGARNHGRRRGVVGVTAFRGGSTMRARVLALFTVLAFPLVAAVPAGAGGGGGGPCTTVSKTNHLTIRDFCFDGVAHLATAGSTITVVNEGQTAHNLIAVEANFGVKGLAPGERYDFQIDRPGVYQYYCGLHGNAAGVGMAGVLVVEDGASLAAARSDAVDRAPRRRTRRPSPARQPGSAWGWVALGALLLAGAALCVSLAVIRPRQTWPAIWRSTSTSARTDRRGNASRDRGSTPQAVWVPRPPSTRAGSTCRTRHTSPASPTPQAPSSPARAPPGPTRGDSGWASANARRNDTATSRGHHRREVLRSPPVHLLEPVEEPLADRVPLVVLLETDPADERVPDLVADRVLEGRAHVPGAGPGRHDTATPR